MSRAQINDRIERKHTEMIEYHSDMQDGFFALIDSYSEAQKDQVRDNLDETRQCMTTMKSSSRHTLPERSPYPKAHGEESGFYDQRS